jgi:hypothetical protein
LMGLWREQAHGQDAGDVPPPCRPARERTLLRFCLALLVAIGLTGCGPGHAVTLMLGGFAGDHPQVWMACDLVFVDGNNKSVQIVA